MQARPLIFETGVSTHLGLVRRRNEDGYLVQPEIGVWAVADGMGGHEAGHIASATVINALQSIGYPASAPDLLARFEDRVNRANEELKQTIRERGTIMGTTVAALLTHERHFACLWSGDSRVYLIRSGTIAQLSRDHSEVQELLDKGVLNRHQARHWSRQNVITRAIGIDEEAELELEHGELQAGDSFVICSDGLTGHVEDDEILDIVRHADIEPQEACDALIALALERGGTDNVTVVVVRCQPATDGGDGPAGMQEAGAAGDDLE